MKKFVFKYSTIIWIMLAIITAIFAAAVVFNVLDAVAFAGEIGARFVFAIIVATLSLAVLILIASALFYGRYVIKDKFLYFHFGLIFTKTDINEIFQLTLFTAQNKLVMYLKNEKYSVVIIDKKNYDAFYEALKKVNPEIIFTVHGTEEQA